MHIASAIDNFISQVEEGLDITFTRQNSPGVIVLQAETPPFILVIYTRGNTARLPMEHIRSFHIDQDQLLKAPHKIISRLQALLGKGTIIYARQTVVARVDKRIALAFQEENHLQAALPGKYRYALFHQGELVSLAIFSGGRKMVHYSPDYRSFELLRFCHKSGFRVVGGLSKLIKSFIDNFHPNDIMTYVDRDWSQASNLRTLGFEEQSQTLPQYFWIDGAERYPVKDLEQIATFQEKYPLGYLSHNNGSTKLVLKL